MHIFEKEKTHFGEMRYDFTHTTASDPSEFVRIMKDGRGSLIKKGTTWKRDRIIVYILRCVSHACHVCAYVQPLRSMDVNISSSTF